jgi:hypothetical protein
LILPLNDIVGYSLELGGIAAGAVFPLAAAGTGLHQIPATVDHANRIDSL